jgi:NADH:ubiquinone oxidoreductase subunit
LSAHREEERRRGVLVGRDTFGNAYYENRRYPTSAPPRAS